MSQHRSKMVISLKPEQRHALTKMAHHDGQPVDVLIERILDSGSIQTDLIA